MKELLFTNEIGDAEMKGMIGKLSTITRVGGNESRL